MLSAYFITMAMTSPPSALRVKKTRNYLVLLHTTSIGTTHRHTHTCTTHTDTLTHAHTHT